MAAGRAIWAAALSCCLVFTACTGDNAEDPVTAPSLTPVASPEQDSIEVYRDVVEVINAQYASGDYREFPEELIELTTDPYLGELETQFQDAAANGLRIPRASEMPVRIATYSEPGASGERSVQACRDARQLESFGWDGASLGYGVLTYDIAELRLVDGRYRVYQVHSEVVETCPFEL